MRSRTVPKLVGRATLGNLRPALDARLTPTIRRRGRVSDESADDESPELALSDAGTAGNRPVAANGTRLSSDSPT